jgi:hypothetical protein
VRAAAAGFWEQEIGRRTERTRQSRAQVPEKLAV